MKPKYLLIILLLFLVSSNYSQDRICTTFYDILTGLTPNKTIQQVEDFITKGSTHFLVHYTVGESEAKVDIILASAELAYNKLITDGWNVPNQDGGLRGDARIDIFYNNLGGSDRTIKDNNDLQSVYININSNNDDNTLEYEVAHQVCHASQYTYYYNMDIGSPYNLVSFAENSAAWFGEYCYNFSIKYYDKIFNSVNLLNNPIENPELSNYYMDGYYEQANLLWPRFLAVWKNDPTIIRKIWQDVAANNETDAVNSINRVLQNNYSSNFNLAFEKYNEWLFFNGNYNDGNHFNDPVLPTPTLQNNVQNFPFSMNFNCENYSRNFVLVTTQNNDYLNFGGNNVSNMSFDLFEKKNNTVNNVNIPNANGKVSIEELSRGFNYFVLCATNFNQGSVQNFSTSISPYKQVFFYGGPNGILINGTDVVANGDFRKLAFDSVITEKLLDERIYTGALLTSATPNGSAPLVNGHYEKHINWNGNGSTYKLENIFTVDAITPDQYAYFQQIYNAKIQNNIIDGLTIPANSTTIQFNDPWYVDQSGNQPGTLLTFNAPYEPNGKYGETSKGIFKEIYNKYKVSLSSLNSIYNPITGKTHKLYFQNWNVSQGSADIITPNSNNTLFTLLTANTIINANYKATQLSNSVNAYVGNGQKKYINDGSKLYNIYESNNNIYIEFSTDNGVSWSMLNGGLPINDYPAKHPCIDHFNSFISGSGSQNMSPMEIQYDVIAAFEENVNGISRICVYDAVTGLKKYVDTYDCTQPVIATLSSHKFVVAYKLTSDNESYIGYRTGNTLTHAFDPIDNFIDEVEIHQSNPTIASNKNDNIYQLAYQVDYASGNSAIKYTMLTDNNGVISQSPLQVISTGSGYTKNYNPSLIAVPGAGARVVWTGWRYLEEEEITDINIVFKDPTYYRFWTFGSNVNYANINRANSSSGGYAFGWSENTSNFVNKYANSSLSTIHTLNTVGKELQIGNADVLTSMNAMSYQSTSVPYSFSMSNNLVLSKETKTNIAEAREGVLYKKNNKSEFYFKLADVSLNGNKIQFIPIADTVDVTNVNGLNNYMTTEEIHVDNNSNLVFSFASGLNDQKLANKFFNDNEYIKLNIEIIDAETNEILGTLDQIALNGNNLSSNGLYVKVNTSGIENKNVRLRLKFDSNIDLLCSLIKKYDDNESINKDKSPKEISYTGSSVITNYALEQNYPNPFNPSTKINYQLLENGFVTLKIYDILGKEVASLVNGYRPTGKYTVNFDASNLASGIYIYQIKCNSFISSKKMMLMK